MKIGCMACFFFPLFCGLIVSSAVWLFSLIFGFTFNDSVATITSLATMLVVWLIEANALPPKP